MVFITVASINAQFSVSAGGAAGVSGLGGAAPTAGQAATNIGYSDSPVITFVPQVDAGLYKSLEAPLGLEEAIGYIVTWGHYETPAFGLCLGSINYAADRQGPAGDAYRERLAALVRLFKAGASIRHFREFTPGHFVSVPKDQVTPRDLAEGSKAGITYYENEDGTVSAGVMALGVGIAVPLPHEGRTLADLTVLGLTPGKQLYPVRPPQLATPKPLGIQPDTLWVTPRSVSGMLELTVLHVDVPEEHQLTGLAPPQDTLRHTGVTLPLTIRHSRDEPAFPYRIQHRGYWFYIDDTDTASKLIFMTAVHAYSSRLGSVAPDAVAPQIVLPVGGA